jgi:hypothetical protein
MQSSIPNLLTYRIYKWDFEQEYRTNLDERDFDWAEPYCFSRFSALQR